MKSSSFASVLNDTFNREDKNKSSVSRFLSSKIKCKIYFSILNNHEKNLKTSMKSIVKLNMKSCSAKTTYNILKQLEYEKLIDRFNHKSDKRVVMFVPSQITLEEFKNWAEQLKNSLNNVIS